MPDYIGSYIRTIMQTELSFRTAMGTVYGYKIAMIHKCARIQSH